MSVSPWPEADERFLRESAATMSLREIADALGRPYEAVRSYARTRDISGAQMLSGSHGRGWTEERFEAAKKLWLAGFSASEVAKQIGGKISRSGVLGKMHRAGLTGPNGAHKRASAPRAAPAPKPIRVAAPWVSRPVTRLAPAPAVARVAAPIVTAPAPEPEPLRTPPEVTTRTANLLPIEALDAHTCKWPFGDPLTDGFGYCGCAKESDAVYCAEHARVAYMPQSAEKKRAGAKLYAYLTKAA